MNTKVGEKIRLKRENKGYSREEMAEKLNISRSAYARIERGETNSWINHIDKLSEELDIKLEDLLANSDNHITTNQDNASAVQNNTHNDTHITINQISEKIIELYEERLKEKDEIINQLKETIELLKNS